MSKTFTEKEAIQLIEDMHSEVFNCFHNFRKERTQSSEILINGADINKIIVTAKKRIKRENNLHQIHPCKS